MDQPKIERVLRLMWLLTANDTYTIEELADMLDTSPRTIYRYLDTFKAAGFSVRKHKEHYSLTKESKYFVIKYPPLKSSIITYGRSLNCSIVP